LFRVYEDDYISIVVIPNQAAFINPKKGNLTNWARIGVTLPVYVEGQGIFQLPFTCAEAAFKFLSAAFACHTAEGMKEQRGSVVSTILDKIVKAETPKAVKNSTFACKLENFNKALWDGPEASDGKLGLAFEAMKLTLLFKLANQKVSDYIMQLISFLKLKFGVASGSVYFGEFKDDKRWGTGYNVDESVTALVSILIVSDVCMESDQISRR